MNTKMTDIDRDFRDMPDNPSFTKEFWRGFNICLLISVIFISLVTAALLNADAIDNFFQSVFKWVVL